MTRTPQELVELIDQHDLASLAEPLSAALVPAIRLQPQPFAIDPLPLGLSRIGGNPDLPPSSTWPELFGCPYSFIAQIRLSDVPRTPSSPLPAVGWLRIWYNFLAHNNEDLIQRHDDKFCTQVLLLQFDADEAATLSRREWPSSPASVDSHTRKWFQPARASQLVPEPSHALDRRVTRDLIDRLQNDPPSDLEDPDEAADRLDDLLTELQKPSDLPTPPLQLLGDFYEPTNPGDTEAARLHLGLSPREGYGNANGDRVRAIADELRLLLHIPSDTRKGGAEWGDGGSLEFWIRQDDLAAGRLDKAIGVFQNGG